jgi:PKD repeat protein
MINGGRNTATFANGLRQVTVTTDSLGRATITELNPLGKGAFQIEARAAYQGQTATTTIHQTNFATTAQAAKAGKAPGQGGQSGASSGSTGTTTASTASAGAGAGGGLSALAIGGIVGGAAAGTAIAVGAAKGGNKAPAVSGITANPSAALLGTNTPITFSVQASDQDNDQLTYSWDFGDGATSTQQAPSHLYNIPGTFIVKVTVSDAKSSASSQTKATVKTLTGTWRSTPINSFFGTVQWVLNLSQSGTSVTGSTPSVAGTTGTFTPGTLDGSVRTASPRVMLTLVLGRGVRSDGTPVTFNDSFFALDAGPDADTLTGTWGTAMTGQITLTRQ